jgi:dephospho-CoA kinase
MTDEEARARIAAQLPTAEKARQATVVLENAGSEAELLAMVDGLVDRLRGER